MFKKKKPSVDNGSELPKVFVDSEVPGGPGTVFLAGSSAAWAQSFKIQKSPASSPGTQRRGSTKPDTPIQEDDEPSEDDDDLLNPAIDEAAWNSDWYVEKATAPDVQHMLKDKPDKAFIIRDSTSEPGAFSLSFRFQGTTSQVVIHNTPKGLQLGNAALTFGCLSDLVFHYSQRWQAGDPIPCPLQIQNSPSSPPMPRSHPPALADLRTSLTGSPQSQLGSRWSVQDVKQWLAHIGSPDNAALFEEHRIDGPQLLRLSIQDMLQWGMTPTDAARVLAGISNLTTGVSPSLTALPIEALADASPGAATPPGVSPSLKKRAAPPIPSQVAPQAQAQSSSSSQPHAQVQPATSPGPSRSSSLTPATKPTLPRSILKRDSVPSKKTGKVRFDEESMAVVQQELRSLRGIFSRVSFETRDSIFYLGAVLRNEAIDRLQGAPNSAFVIFESLSSTETLYILAVFDGDLTQIVLEDSPTGLRIKRSKKRFETLEQLLEHYGKPNKELPGVLNADLAREFLAGMPISIQDAGQATSPTPGIDDRAHVDAPWYHAVFSDEKAIELIEFEPTGSFVVYDKVTQKEFFLTYVHEGRVKLHVIYRDSPGYRLADTWDYFDSLPGLLQNYGRERSPVLACLLKLPPALATGAPVVVEPDAEDVEPERETDALWFQPEMQKDQAVEEVFNGPNGAFVIRQSISRPDCLVLTYRYQDQAYHELILPHHGKVPGLYLEISPEKSFATIDDLVSYYLKLRPELKCKLILPNNPAIAPDPAPRLHRRPTSRPQRGTDDGPGDSPSTSPRRQRRATGYVAESVPEEEEQQAHLSPPNPATDPARSPSMKHRASSDGLHGQSKLSSGASVSSLTSKSTTSRVDGRAALAPWCCLSLPKEEGAKQLPLNRDGAFLVCRTDSEEAFATILVVSGGRILHFPVIETLDGLKLAQSPSVLPNLSAFVAYHKHSTQQGLPQQLVSW
eukprot:m.16647 g.16647  ORF g.16647 m.16647 type:complete len:961 (-) comp28546_c0_seq1:3435-6317(-)